MLSNYQISIILFGFVGLLNLALVAILWSSLKRRLAEQAALQQRSPALNPNSVKQLEDKALQQLEWRVTAAIKDFDAALSKSVSTINQKLSSMIIDVIDREMTAYHSELEKARQQAVKGLEQVQSAADQLQAKQRAEMAAVIESEKQKLVNKLDQKLSDILASYLVESLGKEIDLGAQTKYLLATLDKNKQQLKKDILSD